MIPLQGLVAVLVSIFSFFSFLVSPATVYEPKEEGVLLNASVLSDLHVGPRNPLLQYYVDKAFRSASAAKDGSDALVILGDNTMDGMEQQYLALYTSLLLNNSAKNLLVASGNHDVWSSGGFHKAAERFITYNNLYSGNPIEKMYYYKIINGYYFIVMSTEADMGVSSFLSQTQLDWLDGVLAEATAEGKPAFVFHHFPFNRTYEPEKLKAILTKYSNVLYFTGHMHHPLNENTFQAIGASTYWIDVPGFHGDDDDLLNYTGNGFQIEAYADHVLLRARCYITGEWLPDYEYVINLV